MLVWYDDDEMWHERIFLWPARRKADRPVCNRWVILTPDDDAYEEDMDQAHDVQKVVELADDGSRPYIAEEFYCWDEPMEDASSVSWIRKGRAISLADSAANAGTVPHDYTQFVTWAGGCVALPADLKSGRDLQADRRPAKAPLPAPGAPPSGEQWSLVTPCGGFKIGDRVPVVNVLRSAGDYATVRLRPGPGAGAVVLLEKPSGVPADEFIEEQKKQAAAFYGLEAWPEPDDMRTLGIELNS